VIEAFII